nr:hypothetical protein [Tanacetum cinerariifolium]
ALKEQLNKLKGKAVLTEAVSLNPIDPDLLKVDVAPLVPKLRKNRKAHTDYIRHTQEETATLREIIEMLAESMSQDNTKKNRIRPTPRKAKKNKIEDHLRIVKYSLNKKSVVDSKATSSVINSITNSVNAACAHVTAVGPKPTNNTTSFNASSPSDNAVSSNFEIDDAEDVGAEADFSNLETNIFVSPILTTRVHKDHPTYKQLYDSIKSSRVRSKEQCDDLINKVNLKSAEVFDLNASLQEKV